MNGDYETKVVVVLSVFDSGNERFSSRARIKLYEGNESGQLPEIPVQYLLPVPPSQPGETVIFVLGDYKLAEAHVKEVTGANALVSIDRTHLLVETKLTQLCRRIDVTVP